MDEEAIRAHGARSTGSSPAYKRIDTCAAEFESFTPYMYGTFEPFCESEPNDRRKVVILGSGPNRIGQGIEFDYCCCHAAFALHDQGFETVMINCNPETVSTDYDTTDRLYFEPLTFEDVMAVIDEGAERRRDGVVPGAVRRADAAEAGAAAAGSRRRDPGHVARLDRPGRRPAAVLEAAVGSRHPAAVERHGDLARRGARRRRPRSGFPSWCGRRTCSAAAAWRSSTTRRRSTATWRAPWTSRTSGPVLIDKFLEDAFEFDVDCVADATGAVVIGGIMEHIEQAGIHSGDSSCVVPPFMVAERHLGTIRDYTRRIARALKVVGLMNVQYAIKDDVVYVLEVNPRASRTVPYLSKATGDSAGEDRRARDGRADAGGAGPRRRSRGGGRVREEPGVPVRAVPRRRHDSRARR